MTLIEKIKSNIEVHGLYWAAQHHKKLQKDCKLSNFDTFYFAVFGKWPKR